MAKLININKSFGDKKVLQNFSQTFEKGKISAVLGESGCGKTTMLRILAGIIKPDSGDVLPEAKKISYSFQESVLLPWLTVEQNIKLVLCKEKLSKEKIVSFLKNFDLINVEDSFPDELSGGMRQRVSLARAFLHGGDLLLLDEPFSELDEVTAAKIINFIKLNKGERTIVFITHSTSQAESLADYIFRF